MGWANLKEEHSLEEREQLVLLPFWGAHCCTSEAWIQTESILAASGSFQLLTGVASLTFMRP